MMKKKLDMKKIENNINYGNPNTKLMNCIVNNILMSSLLWEVIQD